MLRDMKDCKVAHGGGMAAQQRIPIMTCIDNSGRAKDAIQTDATVEDLVREKETRCHGLSLPMN